MILCVCVVLASDFASKHPHKQRFQKRVKLGSTFQQLSKLGNPLKVKVNAKSANSSPSGLISKIIHVHSLKRKLDGKKSRSISNKATAKPFCDYSSSVPFTILRKGSGVRANTLFTSHNWGTNK